MKFRVLSRQDVGKFVCDMPHVVISIHDPSTAEPVLADCPQRVGVLRLEFSDLDHRSSQFADPPGTWPEDAKRRPMRLITREQARAILDFVEEHLDIVKLIVVHCEAGISRSAGVAAALSKIINGDDAQFFRQFLPNMFVYSLILELNLYERPLPWSGLPTLFSNFEEDTEN